MHYIFSHIGFVVYFKIISYLCLMIEKITIRKATIEDAEMIARGFLTAMWMSDEEIARLMPSCVQLAQMNDTLYSWRNTFIAQYEGNDAAVLICYNGATYKESALKTFTLVRDNGGDDFTQMTQEAEPGEWYLDTLAVFPEYRRKGIATELLRHGIREGLLHPDINAVTLYVDPEHPWVVNLYKSVGFEHDGEAFIFGQTYEKMAIKKP